MHGLGFPSRHNAVPLRWLIHAPRSHRRPSADEDPISASSEFATFLRTAVQSTDALRSDVLSKFLGDFKPRLAAAAAMRPGDLKGLEDNEVAVDEDMEDENPSAPSGPQAFAAMELSAKQFDAAAIDVRMSSATGSPFEYSQSDSRSEPDMATFLRVALMPYVANVVFPTEAVIDIADDLSNGDVDVAYSKVKQASYDASIFLTTSTACSDGASPATNGIVGFSFVPGYCGVPPTPPSSPHTRTSHSSSDTDTRGVALSSDTTFFAGCTSPPSSPASGARRAGFDAEAGAAATAAASTGASIKWSESIEFPRAPASSPVHGPLRGGVGSSPMLSSASLCDDDDVEVINAVKLCVSDENPSMALYEVKLVAFSDAKH